MAVASRRGPLPGQQIAPLAGFKLGCSRAARRTLSARRSHPTVTRAGGYQDDRDEGEWFLYTGSGGRDLSGNKRTNKEQAYDQKFESYNKALLRSCERGLPVRVVRSYKEKLSAYAPPDAESALRYDGIYKIVACWRTVGSQGATRRTVGDRPRLQSFAGHASGPARAKVRR